MQTHLQTQQLPSQKLLGRTEQQPWAKQARQCQDREKIRVSVVYSGWENWPRVTGRASRGQLHSALALQAHFSVLWDPSPAPPAVLSHRTDCGHLQCRQSNSWKNRLLGQKLHCPPPKKGKNKKKNIYKYINLPQVLLFNPPVAEIPGLWADLSLSPWLRWQSCSSANQGQGCATYSNDYRHNSLVPTLC